MKLKLNFILQLKLLRVGTLNEVRLMVCYIVECLHNDFFSPHRAGGAPGHLYLVEVEVEYDAAVEVFGVEVSCEVEVYFKGELILHMLLFHMQAYFLVFCAVEICF